MDGLEEEMSSTSDDDVMHEKDRPIKSAFSLLKEENKSENYVKDMRNAAMDLLKEARDGNVDKVVDLLCRGVPFISDSTGVCPLHFAAYKNSVPIVELLLKGGCFHGLKNKFERTSLHIAAQMNHIQVLKTLLAFGADQDATDIMNMTPLHWASENGNIGCIRILLMHGAKNDVVDIFGRTALDVAKNRETATALRLLMTQMKAKNKPLIQCSGTLVESTQRQIGIEEANSDEYEKKTSSSSEDESSQDSFDDTFKTGHQSSLPNSNSLPESHTNNDKDPMELLREHGIQMLEPDKVTTVHSAVKSGQKIVLTEAGKLALDEVNTFSPPGKSLPEAVIVLQNGQKRIKIQPHSLKKFELESNSSFLKDVEPSTSYRYFNGKLYSEGETENLKLLLLSSISKLRREGRMLDVFAKRKFRQANMYQQQLLSLMKTVDNHGKNEIFKD